MIWGSVWGAGWGSYNNMIFSLEANLVNNGAGLGVIFEPAFGFGNAYYGIYVNGVFQGSVFAAEGVQTSRNVFTGASDNIGTQSLTLLRQGKAGDYDQVRIARYFEIDTSQTVTVELGWGYEIIGGIDSNGDDVDPLSNWTLDGVSYAQTGRVDNYNTRGTLALDVVVSGGSATVTLSDNEQVVASGSGAIPSMITLAEQNTSGISGTVDVAAGMTTLTGDLYFRWAKSIDVLRNTTSPPTSVIDTVLFPDADLSAWTEKTALAAGTYYYALKATSDTGDIGNQSATDTVIIPGIPDDPENLAYVSGNATSTVLSFSASTTPGATYRAYLRNINETHYNLNTINATAGAGATSITVTGVTGYPGTAAVIVRAVNAGVEEKNGNELKLEYDAAGAFVPPRPNAPYLSSYSVGNGLTLSVSGIYLIQNEAASPTTLQMFVRLPENNYVFTVVDASAALSAVNNGKRTATISHALTTGWYYITLKTATAAGTQSEFAADEELIYISDVNAAAPAGDFILSRG